VTNLLSYVSTVIIESEGKVWSVYIHNVNRITRFKDKMWPCEFTKWRPDTTGNGVVRSAVPENPALQPNTKSIWQLTRCWDMAIWNFYSSRATFLM